MLSTEDESRLSPLARRFRAAFQAALPQLAAHEVVDDGYRLQIPPQDEHTGGMEVLVEPQEISVSVGCHWHSHFTPGGHDPLTNEGQPDGTKTEAEACDEAIRFMQDVMNDRLLIRVYLRGDQVQGAKIQTRDQFNLDTETGEFRDYVWSGPVRRVGEV